MEVDGRAWFLAVFNPPLELVVVGAAHIAQPLTQDGGARPSIRCASSIRVTAFASPERFPGVALSHDWPDEALAKAPARRAQRAGGADA